MASYSLYTIFNSFISQNQIYHSVLYISQCVLIKNLSRLAPLSLFMQDKNPISYNHIISVQSCSISEPILKKILLSIQWQHNQPLFICLQRSADISDQEKHIKEYYVYPHQNKYTQHIQVDGYKTKNPTSTWRLILTKEAKRGLSLLDLSACRRGVLNRLIMFWIKKK